MKKKFFINGTSSYNWLGATVGIIRTEEEIIKALHKELGKNLQICVWKNEDFQIVGYRKYLKKRNKYQLNIIKEIILKQKYIVQFKIILYRMFSFFILKLFLSNNGILNFFKKNLYYRIKKNTKIYNRLIYIKVFFTNPKALKSLFFSSYKTNPEFNNKYSIFSKNDFFLSFGLEWAEKYPASFHDLKKRGVNIATICYDLIPIKFPSYCFVDFSNEFSEYLVNILHGSCYIFCISDNTKKDLTDFIYHSGAPSPKLIKLKLGSSMFENFSKVKNYPKPNIKNKFILYVSTIETRKNHQLVIDVYLLARKKGIDLPNIFFIGMQGWGTQNLINQINNDSYLNKKISVLNNVDDQRLGEFYKNTLFCIYPSLYEGWGLPIIEAAGFGKVTLCSDIKPLREAGGKFMKYINPNNPEKWLDAIHLLYSDNLSLQKIQKKIINNFPIQNWEDTAKQIISNIRY